DYTKEDVIEALKAIDPQQSKEFAQSKEYYEISQILKKRNSKKPFVVSSRMLRDTELNHWLSKYLVTRTGFQSARTLENTTYSTFGDFKQAIQAAGIQTVGSIGWNRELILNLLIAIHDAIGFWPAKAVLLKESKNPERIALYDKIQAVIDAVCPFPTDSKKLYQAIISKRHFPGGMIEVHSILTSSSESH